MTLGCPRCAAPLEVPADASSLACGRCGAGIEVERTENAVTLRRSAAEPRSDRLVQLANELEVVRQHGEAGPHKIPRWVQVASLFGSLACVALYFSGSSVSRLAAALLAVAGIFVLGYFAFAPTREESRRIEEDLHRVERVIAELKKMPDP